MSKESTPHEPSGIRGVHIGGAITGLAAVAYFIVAGIDAANAGRALGPRLAVAAWLVLPPIYFFVEFHWVRKKCPEILPRIRESQELSEKIWAGVAAALVILYLEG